MIQSLSEVLGGLSAPVLIAIAVVVVVQCVFQVYCLVDLWRRPAVMGGRKWLWALIIVAAGLLGALVYFALGRVPAGSASTDAGAGGADATRRALDRLYRDNK